MLDAPTSPPSDGSSLGDAHWHALIDDLVAGIRDEDDFVAEVCRVESTVIDASWTAVGILDQRFRLGQVPMALYRSIEQKISQREMTRNGDMDPRDATTSAALPMPQISRVLLLAADLSAEEIAAAASPCDGPTRKDDVDHDEGGIVTARPLGGVTINLRTYRWKPLKAAKPASTTTMPQAPRASGAGHTSLMMRYADVELLPRPIEPGRVLRNRYVLESVLGAGGMGTVYKALDRLRADLREDGRHVAVKILHQSADDDDMTRLRREFFCAQALSHPHIVKVFELDRDGDIAYFTMELLNGRLLSVTIDEARDRTVPRTVAWIIIRDVAAALAYAHSRQVVHGDLKPQNIMVTESGEVHILDFGASHDPRRIRGDDETAEATPAYATSEVLEGQMPEPGDDLYALACISYELLSGAHPFEGHSATEARKLGLTPARPPLLSDRQWRAMSRVLDGQRKDRAMSVDAWVSDMLPAPPGPTSALNTSVAGSSSAGLTLITGVGTDVRQRATDAVSIFRPTPAFNWRPTKTQTLASRPNTDAELPADSRSKGAATPSIAEPASTTPLSDDGAFIPNANLAQTGAFPRRHVPAPRSSLTRNSTLMIAVLISATIWAALAQPWARPHLADAPATLQVSSQIAPLSVTLAGEPPPTFLTVKRSDANTMPVPPRLVAAASRQLRFTADSYYLRTGQRFAELRIVRSKGWDGDAKFVWWTEGGSARPGTDYAQQRPALQVMAKSQRRTTLFIKIPDGANVDRKTFYVAMADPHGRSVSGVIRAMVTIPPRRGHGEGTVAQGETPAMPVARDTSLARGH